MFHEKDAEGKIIKTTQTKSIEEEIINHNKKTSQCKFKQKFMITKHAKKTN